MSKTYFYARAYVKAEGGREKELLLGFNVSH